MEIAALTQKLIALETRPEDGEGAEGRAAFRVCEKLREPLCVLAGAAGYRSLLLRALALARRRSPWLAELKTRPDGALDFPAEAGVSRDADEAAAGGAILLSELLGLLSTLIGDALTLRLVRNVWPGLEASPSKPITDPS